MPPPAHDLERRPSVLLIDDDPISREVLAMLLEADGYRVASAESGAEALALLDTAPAEVVLMDTQMPGVSGLELIQRLRRKTKARLVAISGSEPGEPVRNAADGFLLKPIQPERLTSLLAAGLDPAAKAAEPKLAAVESSATTSGSVIDPQVLGKLRAMMPPSAVREIYAAVASDLKPRLAGIEAAMRTNNPAEVARIAHAIKGGCAMVGLTQATQAAAQLESSNRNGTWRRELSQLHDAQAALERILMDEFPT